MKFISRLMCFCFFLPSGNCLHCVISHPLKLSGKKYWITSFSCLFFRQFIGSEKLPLLYFCLLTSMSVSMKITPPATCRIFAVTVVSFHSANGGFHAFRESLCSLLGFLLKTQTFQIYKKTPLPPSYLRVSADDEDGKPSPSWCKNSGLFLISHYLCELSRQLQFYS